MANVVQQSHIELICTFLIIWLGKHKIVQMEGVNGQLVNGTIVPINNAHIQVNETWHNSEGTAGEKVIPFVETGTKISQQYLLEGKQIVVIGGGRYRMRNMWPDAAKYGIKVTIVEADPAHRAREHAHLFIQYDFSDHTKDFAHAQEIAKLIHTHGIEADACLAFVDDYLPLAALVGEKLGTKEKISSKGPTYEAVTIANSKSRTQHVLNIGKEAAPHWLSTNRFTSESVHLHTEVDCDFIPDSLKFPAMLKLDNGHGAVGASRVETREELKNKFREVTKGLHRESDVLDIGLCHGYSMSVMEFYDGSEHNVDVIIYDRELIGAFITDSGRNRRPYFIATARCMPSTLPEDKQAELINAAYLCCIGIGLTNGTFNVELMMTSTGPKLLEINARMGEHVLREWYKAVYGEDFMLFPMMIACGIKPHVPKHPAKSVLMGIMVIPSLHAKLLTEEHYRNLLNELMQKEEIMFLQFKELREKPSVYDQPFGNIGVSATTPNEARQKLINICKVLGIDQDEYPVEQFIRHF